MTQFADARVEETFRSVYIPQLTDPGHQLFPADYMGCKIKKTRRAERERGSNFSYVVQRRPLNSFITNHLQELL